MNRPAPILAVTKFSEVFKVDETHVSIPADFDSFGMTSMIVEFGNDAIRDRASLILATEAPIWIRVGHIGLAILINGRDPSQEQTKIAGW